MLDLILERGIGFQMSACRAVAATCLSVERWGKLRAKRDLGQNPVERIVERVAALRRKWRVRLYLLEALPRFSLWII